MIIKKKKPTTKKKHEAQLPANQTLKDELIFFFKKKITNSNLS
jgi:hypothetical protein